MRFATLEQEVAHYSGRKFKELEMEEQARVRSLVFSKVLAWDTRKSPTGVPITYVKLGPAAPVG